MEALNLKAERLNRGLRQSDLAKIMNTKPQTISNWEKGISTPHYSKLKELESYFKKTIEYLFSEYKEEER